MSNPSPGKPRPNPDTRQCGCDNPACSGRTDELREYFGFQTTDSEGTPTEVSAWKDLVSHCTHDQVVRWVNELARSKQAQRFYHKRNNMRRAMLKRAAEELLAPDEIAAIRRQAEQRAAEHVAEKEGRKR